MNIALYNEYIICIHECGNMTKAAKKLGISQPALSSGLSNLEKKLGFKIFDRKRAPLQLTREGEIYLEYLFKQKEIIEDYERKISDVLNSMESKLVIGGPSVYIKALIVKAVAKLHTEYPECKVIIKDASVPELMEKTKKGEVDCFVCTSKDLPECFAKEEIKREKIYLCIPFGWEINQQLKEYQVLEGKAGSCFEYKILSNMEFIFLEENQPLQKEMQKFFMENQIFPQSHITVNQVPTGIALSALGEGISFASEEALLGSGYINKLCVYALPETISGRKIYVTYNRERYIPYMCQNLIKILKSMNQESEYEMEC